MKLLKCFIILSWLLSGISHGGIGEEEGERGAAASLSRVDQRRSLIFEKAQQEAREAGFLGGTDEDLCFFKERAVLKTLEGNEGAHAILAAEAPDFWTRFVAFSHIKRLGFVSWEDLRPEDKEGCMRDATAAMETCFFKAFYKKGNIDRACQILADVEEHARTLQPIFAHPASRIGTAERHERGESASPMDPLIPVSGEDEPTQAKDVPVTAEEEGSGADVAVEEADPAQEEDPGSQSKKKKKKKKTGGTDEEEALLPDVCSSSQGSSSSSLYEFLFTCPTQGGPHPDALPEGRSWDEQTMKKLLIFAWDWVLKGKRDSLTIETMEGLSTTLVLPVDSTPRLETKKPKSKLRKKTLQVEEMADLFDVGTLWKRELGMESILFTYISFCLQSPFLDFWLNCPPGSAHFTRLDREVIECELGNLIECVLGLPVFQKHMHPLKEVRVQHMLNQLKKFGKEERFVYLYLKVLQEPWISCDMDGTPLPPESLERMEYIVKKGFGYKETITGPAMGCFLLRQFLDLKNPETGRPFSAFWERHAFCYPFYHRAATSREDTVPPWVKKQAQHNLVVRLFNDSPILPPDYQVEPYMADILWQSEDPTILDILAQFIRFGYLKTGPDHQACSKEKLLEDAFMRFPKPSSMLWLDRELASGLATLYGEGLRLKRQGHRIVSIRKEEAFELEATYWSQSHTPHNGARLYLFEEGFKPDMSKEEKQETARKLIFQSQDYAYYLHCLMCGVLKVDLLGKSLLTLNEVFQAGERCLTFMRDDPYTRFRFYKWCILKRIEEISSLQQDLTLGDFREIQRWGREVLSFIQGAEGNIGKGELTFCTWVQSLLMNLEDQFFPPKAPAQKSNKSKKKSCRGQKKEEEEEQERSSSEEESVDSNGSTSSSSNVVSARKLSAHVETRVAVRPPQRTKEERQKDRLARILNKFRITPSSRPTQHNPMPVFEVSVLDHPRFTWEKKAKGDLLSETFNSQKWLRKATKKLLEDILSGGEEGRLEMLTARFGLNREKMWSRRISEEHRLEYYFENNNRAGNIVIRSLLGHYD